MSSASKELLPFQLPEQITEANWEQLHKVLAVYIQQLLDKNTAQLMQIFYRLDVNEQVVRQIFAEQDPQSWADLLATEVLKREQKRLYYRSLYKNKDLSE